MGSAPIGKIDVADIFREIDEDLRADRVARLWKRYGWAVIAAAVVVVLASAGWVAWRDYDLKRQGRAGAEFAAAMAFADRGDVSGATAALGGLIKQDPRGYATVSRLYEAALLERAGKVDEALAEYDAVANDTSVDPLYRDLARLAAAYRRIDKLPPDQLAEQLKPLLADSNPWRFAARELDALARLKAGDVKAARDALTRLSDDATAPQGVRARATELLAATKG